MGTQESLIDIESSLFVFPTLIIYLAARHASLIIIVMYNWVKLIAQNSYYLITHENNNLISL